MVSPWAASPIVSPKSRTAPGIWTAPVSYTHLDVYKRQQQPQVDSEDAYQPQEDGENAQQPQEDGENACQSDEDGITETAE